MTGPAPDGAQTDTSSNSGNPGSSGSPSGGKGGKAASASAPLAPLEVVVFTHHDPILCRSRRAVGVVVDVDDQGVTVRPLAHHEIRVPLADAQRYDDADDPTS